MSRDKPLPPHFGTPLETPMTLAEQVYEQLEEMIVTLALPPGSLVSESSLSERLGIGRTPIREALQRLRADHLVVVLPRRAVMISEVHVEQHLLAFNVRRELERLIAPAAARRATEPERVRLLELASAMESAAEAGDVHLFLAIDREFHTLEARCAHNPYAAHAIAPLHSLSRRYWYIHHRQHGDIRRHAAVHSKLMRAIAAADERAAVQACEELLEYAEQVTVEPLGTMSLPAAAVAGEELGG